MLRLETEDGVHSLLEQLLQGRTFYLTSEKIYHSFTYILSTFPFPLKHLPPSSQSSATEQQLLGAPGDSQAEITALLPSPATVTAGSDCHLNSLWLHPREKKIFERQAANNHATFFFFFLKIFSHKLYSLRDHCIQLLPPCIYLICFYSSSFLLFFHTIMLNVTINSPVTN